MRRKVEEEIGKVKCKEVEIQLLEKQVEGKKLDSRRQQLMGEMQAVEEAMTSSSASGSGLVSGVKPDASMRREDFQSLLRKYSRALGTQSIQAFESWFHEKHGCTPQCDRCAGLGPANAAHILACKERMMEVGEELLKVKSEKKETRTCSKCGEKQLRKAFSDAQWPKDDESRCCKSCTKKKKRVKEDSEITSNKKQKEDAAAAPTSMVTTGGYSYEKESKPAAKAAAEAAEEAAEKGKIERVVRLHAAGELRAAYLAADCIMKGDSSDLQKKVVIRKLRLALALDDVVAIEHSWNEIKDFYSQQTIAKFDSLTGLMNQAVARMQLEEQK